MSPGDTRARDAWREAGLASGEGWRQAHADRRLVRRLLRRAGYVQRHRWARERVGTRQVGVHVVDDWRYTDGPAVGCQAVDAWRLAEKIGKCAFAWYVQARLTKRGELVGLAVPKLCGQRHECPVCAHARSGFLATALRMVLEDLHQQGDVRRAAAAVGLELPIAPLALVTLTQGDTDQETLSAALDRLDDAWHRMTTGRPGKRFAALVDGWYSGLEVTRGSVGKWWHAHRHVVIRLRPGVDVDAARAEIGRMWHIASSAAAAARGLTGRGWDPVAGGCTKMRDTDGSWLRQPDPAYRGGWWREIDPDDPKAVYQACKYPTPLADLDPVALAEWIAVSHGRRWHEGGGSLRGVIGVADKLEARGAGVADELAAVDLGDVVHRCGPQEVPDLDDVAPDHGWPGAAPLEPRIGMCRWHLTAGSDRAAIAAAAELAGGRVDGDTLELPAEWVSASIRATSAALEEARQRRLRATDPTEIPPE